MRKIILLVTMLLTVAAFAQSNWTAVKETNINVENAVYNGVDIFTNHNGNHIIVQESNNLKYYNMNTNGVADSPITIENSAVTSPTISGDKENLYIVYGINSQVRVKRSTNGGANWTLWTSFNLLTTASSMESVVSNGLLHVTYIESDVVKYRNRSEYNWSTIHTVSTGESGSNPRIITSSQGNMIYFLYEKKNTEIGKWRWYNVATNTWSNIFVGYDYGTDNFYEPAGLNIAGWNLIIYFSSFEPNPVGSQSYYFNKIVVDNFDNTLIHSRAKNEHNFTNRVYSTTTADGISHTAFYFLHWGKDGTQDIAIWRSKESTGDRTDVIYDYAYTTLEQPIHLNLSSAGNEVHTIWQDVLGSNNGKNLRYKFDDQTPSTPQNLTLTNNNGHPRLQWTKNIDADIKEYNIYRKYGSSPWGTNPLATTSSLLYDDGSVTITIPGGPAGTDIYYKITAKDYSNYESDYSNSVSCNVKGHEIEKTGSFGTEVVDNYVLTQNYPNPFNPTTNLKYSVKEKGFVSLKVYDLLGKEVADLVNEDKDIGHHSVNFNASELPSGIYIYSIRVNDFSQSRKMLLLK